MNQPLRRRPIRATLGLTLALCLLTAARSGGTSTSAVSGTSPSATSLAAPSSPAPSSPATSNSAASNPAASNLAASSPAASNPAASSPATSNSPASSPAAAGNAGVATTSAAPASAATGGTASSPGNASSGTTDAATTTAASSGGKPIGAPTATSLDLPAPTGASPTGTTLLHLRDNARVDALDPRSGKRELMVQVWYPAEKSDRPLAPYAPAGEAALQKFYPVAAGAFSVLTHSRTDAPASSGKRPVVFFHHGLCGSRTDSTIVAEQLPATATSWSRWAVPTRCPRWNFPAAGW